MAYFCFYPIQVGLPNVKLRILKIKAWKLANSVVYASQTRNQQRFTVSEVVAD